MSYHVAANPALAPSPALFDVTTIERKRTEGRIMRAQLDQLELAPNPRRDISPDGIDRLAEMLARTGQITPCIGHRPSRTGSVIIYDGQRRLLAARRSHELASTSQFEGLEPVQSLIVLLLLHAPSSDEIRRIQAHANASETLSLPDQQEQLRDCWQARAGLEDSDRLAAVCADLGLSPRKARNLLRQLTLPDEIRARVAERPAAGQISPTMANRLAAMNDIAPKLTTAVAERITSPELHDQALSDLGAFVHRTLLENEHAYAVRVDDGALLDAHQEIQHARAHLTPDAHAQLASVLGCEPGKIEQELDALAARAKTKHAKIAITPEIRDRARAGRYAYTHQRGQDFADTIWIIDPAFTIDLAREALEDGEEAAGPSGEAGYFTAGGGPRDEELAQAAAQDRDRRAAERERHARAERSNLGLGHDITARLMDPTDRQLHALKAIICHLLARSQREIIAYGAGWTDRDRQQPVGDSGHYEPRHVDLILQAELDRALEDPDPLRGIAQLVARWAAAFILDPDGATRTKTLGTERMSRRLQDALPGGENPLRHAVWEFMRPVLSPALVERNRDAFITDPDTQSTVTLHHRDTPLHDLNLGDDDAGDAEPAAA